MYEETVPVIQASQTSHTRVRLMMSDNSFNNQSTGVPPFRQERLEKDARKNWDLFYKRNGDRFFKDRHWTTREFGELLANTCNQQEEGQDNEEGSEQILLEVGCGAGNFIFPLIQDQIALFCYGCDFSDRAVNLCQANCLNHPDKSAFFVADLTSPEFHQRFIDAASYRKDTHVDLISIIFVLSSIHPEKHELVVQNLSSVLKTGGVVLFRDYAINDMAMHRFKPANKLSERFFARQDGTRAFYFDTENLANLFEQQGFEVIENSYIKRLTVNLKEDVRADRTFLQAKFRKK